MAKFKIDIKKEINEKRIPKSEKFIKEQNDIKLKLDKILGISSTNNKFLMCDIDEKKQKDIEDLLDDIKKYYPCSSCRWFKKGVDKLFIALMKYVYKYANYNVIFSHKIVERNGEKIKSIMYVIDSVEIS